MRLVGQCTVWLLAIVAIRLTMVTLEWGIGDEPMQWFYRNAVAALALAGPTWLIFRRGCR